MSQSTRNLRCISAAALALFVAQSAFGAPQSVSPRRPKAVVLAPITVTPTGSYTAAEWQARQNAVTLEAVVVTPKAHYTLASWQQHKMERALAQRRDAVGLLRAIWHRILTGTRLVEA